MSHSDSSLPVSQEQHHDNLTMPNRKSAEEIPDTKHIRDDDPLWQEYVDAASTLDAKVIEDWNKILDVVLVFITLFLSIQTSFVIETSKRFKRDPVEVSNLLLLALYNQQARGDNSPINLDSLYKQDPETSFEAHLEYSLLYLGLTFSVIISIVAMIAKVWLVQYLNQGRLPGSPFHRALRRQEAFSGLQEWKLDNIIHFLPLSVLLPVIMFLFYLFSAVSKEHIILGYCTSIIISLGILSLVISSFSAAAISTSPFQTCISKLIRFLFDTALPPFTPSNSLKRRIVVLGVLFAGVYATSIVLMARLRVTYASLAFILALVVLALIRHPQPSDDLPPLLGLPLSTLLASLVIYAIVMAAMYYEFQMRIRLILYSIAVVLIILQGIYMFRISRTTPNTLEAEALAWLFESQDRLPKRLVLLQVRAIVTTRQQRAVLLKALLPRFETHIPSLAERITSFPDCGVASGKEDLLAYLEALKHFSSFPNSARSIFGNRVALQHPVLPERLRESLQYLGDQGNPIFSDIAKDILGFYCDNEHDAEKEEVTRMTDRC